MLGRTTECPIIGRLLAALRPGDRSALWSFGPGVRSYPPLGLERSPVRTLDQWSRGAMHPVRGRFTIEDLSSLMAAHDDTHLEQLKRALEGRP